MSETSEEQTGNRVRVLRGGVDKHVRDPLGVTYGVYVVREGEVLETQCAEFRARSHYKHWRVVGWRLNGSSEREHFELPKTDTKHDRVAIDWIGDAALELGHEYADELRVILQVGAKEHLI